MTLVFYLGTHRPTWLWQFTDTPLFVSHRILTKRTSPYPKATTEWALDSGGFTELSMYGEWRTTPTEYVTAIRRYTTELGNLAWASPQDWMCEPWITAKTGLTVEQHQRRTIDNYLELRSLAPDLPFVPVLQGWELADYHRCVDLYEQAGVDLTTTPVVGVGSVCRRQSEGGIALILETLHSRGLALHGYGVKTEGLQLSAPFLASADSMAWSYGARMEALNGGGHPGCAHATCANCPKYALRWRERLLAGLRWQQDTIPIGATA